MKLLLVLLAFVVFTGTVSAAPKQHSGCKLNAYPEKHIVVVASQPCFYHDFPGNCIVPRVIRKGLVVYCPVSK